MKTISKTPDGTKYYHALRRHLLAWRLQKTLTATTPYSFGKSLRFTPLLPAKEITLHKLPYFILYSSADAKHHIACDPNDLAFFNTLQKLPPAP